MALCEYVVLFADDEPQGNGHPEIFRAGSVSFGTWFRCRTPAAGCG